MIGQIVSHYRILEHLGGGGMGVVYKAEDTRLKRTVALKFLPPELTRDREAKERLIHEAQAASALQHNNICAIHDIEETADGCLFIVMDYYEGSTLREEIAKGQLPIDTCLNFALQIAEGLQKAHEIGIIHRDIKPANVIVTKDGVAKIVDFGLAKLAGQVHTTRAGSTVGTAAYISPEQSRGEEVDHRTDIWALGVVLYEMLTSKLPFSAAYEAAMLYLILHENPQSIKELRQEVPAKLEALVERCLRKERDERFQEVGEFLAEANALVRALEPGAQGTHVQPAEQKRFESERRPVTILFASILPANGNSIDADPESLTAGLDECSDGLTSIVQKYGGMKDRILGDRIMAVFGAPVAHENDPERAVRCGLEMMSYVKRINSLGISGVTTALQLRIGIHSGVVVAGSVGSEKGTEYSVVGDAINVTAGITDLVPAGEIYLSAETLKRVADIVEIGQARAISIKGKEQEISVYPLQSLRSGLEPGKRVAGGGAFVGRMDELRMFEESLDLVRRNGEVRILVHGEAGVGKSRLKSEVIKRAEGRKMSICEGKCSSLEVNTPYYLWNTLLKSLLRVDLEMPESEVRTRLHEMVKMLSLEPDEPYLAALLSLHYEDILLEEDEKRKRNIFEAMGRLLKKYVGVKPTVVFLEDLHWIDRFSQSLLEFILGGNAVGPALIVCLYRPGYAGASRIRGTSHELDLSRLSGVEARELMRLRCGVDSVPESLAHLIEQRSEGNPFFIEEIIKTLLGKKIIKVGKNTLHIMSEDLESGVPETLQGVILARIDQLEERIREVLLDASVIGREFSRPVLEQIVQKKTDVRGELKKLESLELVFEKEEARELEYLFKHYLIQEVAYNTLLQKKRKRLHGLIASAIEKLYADRLKEFYEVLAFHYEKAEEWEKAADYLSRAGRKMRETFTREESEDFTERKEAALQHLFASETEKATWFYKLLSITTVGLMTLMSIFLLSGGIYFFLWSMGIRSETVAIVFSGAKNDSVGLGIMLILIGSWFLFITLVVVKTQSALGNVTLYEVLDEGISLVFKGGERIIVPFSEIQSVFFLPILRGKKNLWSLVKNAQEYTLYAISHRMFPGYIRWLGNSAPLFSAPSKEGFIGIRRKRGISTFGAQMQIGARQKQIWERVRNIGLTPAHTAQFYDHMVLAFTKWQTRYCLRCSAPLEHAVQCPSCGYRCGTGTVRTDPSTPEGTVIRSVENSVQFLLEFFFNPYVLFGVWMLCVFLFISSTKSGLELAWLFFLLIPLFGVPSFTLLHKKRSHRNYAMAIHKTSLSYVGEMPELLGSTIPFQDILSIRRYANLFQRMLGLGNIEIETRNRVPLMDRTPLFHFVIPNIRESKEVEKLLRERCDCLNVPKSQD
ncbi:MAG: hypothetical protein A3C56_00990 [Ignavibacteria bacterium RIFCSPHIGHO2_02_FULL_56_12]|nr:MAG: hypothetical protein A3C56_00990 [Ignavibacteria bacterium RIFCSPHIGHO2_02_FULL_56_12]